MWAGRFPVGIDGPGDQAGTDPRVHGARVFVHQRRASKMAFGASLAFSILALASCSSNPSVGSQSATTDAASTQSTVAVALNQAATIEASSTGGDAISTTVSFGAVESVANSNVDSSILTNCGFDISRALVVAGELQTLDDSSDSVQVDETLQYVATDPGTMYFVLGLSSGSQCEAPDNNPNVSFTVSRGSPNDFYFWVVLPNTITPDNPSGDPTTLGQWVVLAPSVSLEGNPADTTSVFGPRVVSCGEGMTGNPNLYLVPAGSLPQSVGGDLFGQACSPQPTGNG